MESEVARKREGVKSRDWVLVIAWGVGTQGVLGGGAGWRERYREQAGLGSHCECPCSLPRLAYFSRSASRATPLGAPAAFGRLPPRGVTPAREQPARAARGKGSFARGRAGKYVPYEAPVWDASPVGSSATAYAGDLLVQEVAVRPPVEDRLRAVGALAAEDVVIAVDERQSFTQLCERVRQTVLSGELVPGAVVSPFSSHSSTTFPVRRWVSAVVESPRRSDWRPAPHRASRRGGSRLARRRPAACLWLLQEDPPVAGGVVAQLFDRAHEPLYALGDERAVKGLAWDLPPWPAAR